MSDRPRMAVLTARSRGAIAVVRAWGVGAVSAVSAAFRPANGRPLAGSSPGRPRLGRIGRGAGDEVVAVVEVGPEPLAVEVHPHGGPAALELVLEALEAAGLVEVPAAEFPELRALGPTARDALEDLADAPTVRVAEVLLDQSQGVLDAELARLEGLLNDPETRPEAREALESLEARGGFGLRLLKGWTVAIVGRPNAGKSRLLNALIGHERAIVSPTAGTTRDAIRVETALEGWPVRFVDTAGLREATGQVEAEGVRIALRQAAAADLILRVVDRSEKPIETDALEHLDSFKSLLVLNKSDLPTAWPIDPPRSVVISAESGEGLDRLIAEVARRLVPDPPDPGDPVPFRTAHLARIAKLREWGRCLAIEVLGMPPGF